MARYVGALVVLLWLACTDAIPPYSVSVRNRSSVEVQDATVSYGEFRLPERTLRPGDKTTQIMVPVPIGDRAVVSWRTPDGGAHTKEVDLKSVVQPGFSGDILFDIRDGGDVQVSVKPSS